MFFIFNNAMKTEAVIVFDEEPGWFDKSGCIIKGGLVEEVFTGEDLEDVENIIHVCRFK